VFVELMPLLAGRTVLISVSGIRVRKLLTIGSKASLISPARNHPSAFATDSGGGRGKPTGFP